VNHRDRPPYGNNDGHHRRHHGWREERHSGPPESTNQEVQYLRKLIENRTPVTVRLQDNQEVHGLIEYYDRSFIRLTREGQPNLLIFKDKIKYLYEG